MLALLQRVKSASVEVDCKTVGAIDKGILALIGIEADDDFKKVSLLSEKILRYRIFDDKDGKMNLSLKDISGQLLLVPQFTLAADTQKGLRPSFSKAASPKIALELFESMLDLIKTAYERVESGQFKADMAVHLINDGPVTFLLKV